ATVSARISVPRVNLVTELTLILTSSSVTAPPRQTILARAKSCSPRSRTTFSMRHRNDALRCASEIVSSAHICGKRRVRLITLLSSSLVWPLCDGFGGRLSGKRLFGGAHIG